MKNIQSKIISFDLTSNSTRELPLDYLKSKVLDSNNIYWININLTEKESLDNAVKLFDLPKHFVEMCNKDYKSQHVVESENSLSIQLPCIYLDTSKVTKSKIEQDVIAVYLTDKYCLTATAKAHSPLIEFQESLQINIKYAQTPGFTLFLIIDNIVNDYTRVLEYIELLSDDTEAQIRETHIGSYSDVMKIKTKAIKLRRSINTLRDILMRISGRKISVISEPCRLSLLELLAHVITITNEIDSVRDMLNSTLEFIDNHLMQKMNETMKLLTAFTAILLPLTVIAGIYGMNFHFMPELEWEYGYLWAISLMITCAAALTVYFKRKKWF